MAGREEEQELEVWIEAVLGESLSPRNDLAAALKSGIVLCRLIETISPGSLRSNINITSVPLLEMENIGYYLKACWRLGFQSADIFATSDLYLKKNMARVIANLTALARHAASSGKYPGPFHPRFLPQGVSAESNAQISPRHGRPKPRDTRREKAQLETVGAELSAELRALEERNAAASAKLEEQRKLEAELQAKLAKRGDTEAALAKLKGEEAAEAARVAAMKAELTELRRKDEERARLLAEVASAQAALQERLVGLAKLKDGGGRGAQEAMALHTQLSTQLSALGSPVPAPRGRPPAIVVEGESEAAMAAAMAEHLEAEEMNARRSVLVQNAAARQRTLANQLTSDKAAEEAGRKIAALEAEVARLKKAGESAQGAEGQLEALRKAEAARTALAREAAQLQDGLRAKLADIARLEKESQRLRDENHRKSIALREARGGAGGVTPGGAAALGVGRAAAAAEAEESEGRRALVKDVLAANSRLTAQLKVAAEAEEARLAKDKRVFSNEADAALNEELKKLRFVAAKQARQAREGAVFQEDLFRQILLLQDQLDAAQRKAADADERAAAAEERARKAEERARKALAQATAAASASPAPSAASPTAATALPPAVSSKLLYYAGVSGPAAPASPTQARAAPAPAPAPATPTAPAPAPATPTAPASPTPAAAAAAGAAAERPPTPPRRSPRPDGSSPRSRRDKKEKKEKAPYELMPSPTASALPVAQAAPVVAATAVVEEEREEKEKKGKTHRSHKHKKGIIKEEEEARAAEAERKAKEEAERAAQAEAERKAKEEADKKAKEEAERKAKEEADKKAKEEAERKAKEEAAAAATLKAKEEAERKAKEEADKKAKEAAAPVAAVPVVAAPAAEREQAPLQRSKSSRDKKEKKERGGGGVESADDPLASFLTVRQTQARLRMNTSTTALQKEAAAEEPLRALSSILRRLLSSRRVEYADLLRVDAPLATDEGRRKFVSVLKRGLKESPSLVLDEEAFEMLLHLYHRALEHYDAAPALDVRSLAVLMYTSCAIGRKRPASEQVEYLCSYVQSYSVWRNMVFWEELFLEELARKRRHAQRKARAAPDPEAMQALLSKAISAFVHDMLLTWRVPRDAAQEFINQQAARHELPVTAWTALVDDLEAFESLAEKSPAAAVSPADEAALLQRVREKYTTAAKRDGSAVRKANKGAQSVRLEVDGGVDFGPDPFWIGASKKWNRRSRQIPKPPVSP